MDGYECPFDELLSRYATCNDEIQATREANTIWAWCSSRYPVIEPDWEMKLESKRIAANAHAMVHSKLFSPETLKLDKHVVDAAISCVPQDVRSREADTVDSLRERIAACGFFDDLQALKGGGREGKKRVELNDTDYASPRRKSWSLVIEDTHVHRGKRVRTMFNYGKLNSRIRTIAYATPMPTAVYALGKQCFCTARHLLSTGSAMFPPNHCQLMAYYQIFRSKAGVHKDNYKVDPDFRNAMFRAFPFARFITGGVQVIPGLDRAMQQGRAQIEMFCQTASKNAQIDGSDVWPQSAKAAASHNSSTDSTLRDPRIANTVSHIAYKKAEQTKDAAQLTLEDWRSTFAGRVECVASDRLYIVRLDEPDGEFKLGLVTSTGEPFDRDALTDEGVTETVPHMRALWFGRKGAGFGWGKNPAFEPYGGTGPKRIANDLPVESFLVEVTDDDLTEAGLASKWTEPKLKETFTNDKLRWIAEKYGLLVEEPNRERPKRKRA